MINLKEIIKIKNNNYEAKKSFVLDIINSSAPKKDFYIMVSLSTLITALGLISDNIALVIAGMIVAPLLSPILAMALGCIIFNFKVFWRSLKIIIIATLFSLVFSNIIGSIFNTKIESLLLIQKMDISFLSFSIALVAGITASYAWTRINAKDYLSGIAIAVTIIPPLTSMGLALSDLNIKVLIHVSKFFLMNIFGIFIGGLIVFAFMNFYKIKKIAVREIIKEEKNNNI